jgi:hypothetical protein
MLKDITLSVGISHPFVEDWPPQAVFSVFDTLVRYSYLGSKTTDANGLRLGNNTSN